MKADRPKPTFDGALAIDPRFADRFATGDFPPTAGMFDDTDEDALPYERVGDVGVVMIRGPLLQYGGWYWDGHEAIKGRCMTALADPRVARLALRIDSCGGMVAGNIENTRAVRAMAAEVGKPVSAWCGGNGAFSAGYAWACVADAGEIFLPDVGGAGSVGVLCTLGDETGMNAQLGLRRVVVRSGTRKADGHPDLPLTDDVIAREQAIVNGMAEVFAGFVGTARKMKPADILAYEGESFYGVTAVQKNIADGVMSWDDFLARCEAQGKDRTMKGVNARLGLAADVGEQAIVAAIDALEQKATVAEQAATGERKAHLALIVANGIRDRKIDKAEGDQLVQAATGMRDGSAWLTGLLASKSATALPVESTEPSDKPRRSGPSTEHRTADLTGKSDGDLAVEFEKLGSGGQLELSKRDPGAFTAMQAAWRKSKGMAR